MEESKIGHYVLDLPTIESGKSLSEQLLNIPVGGKIKSGGIYIVRKSFTEFETVFDESLAKDIINNIMEES